MSKKLQQQDIHLKFISVRAFSEEKRRIPSTPETVISEKSLNCTYTAAV
jgi:hypothetical protein